MLKSLANNNKLLVYVYIKVRYFHDGMGLHIAEDYTLSFGI